MRRWHEERKNRPRIEIIPMIDVMMFLLVFFVLISINVIPAFGVRIHLPASANPSAHTERHRVMISLAKNGRLQLDGAEIGGDDLVPRLAAIRQAQPQVSVVIDGDRDVDLQSVVGVMDSVKAAGFPSVSIAARRNPAK